MESDRSLQNAGNEQDGDQEDVGRDGGDAMGLDHALVSAPWEHEYAKEGHEFVGPEKTGKSENEESLAEDGKSQFVDHGISGGGKQNIT